MNASWMDAYCLFKSAAMAFAESSGDIRSSEGFNVANTIPEFGLLVKPLMDSPGKATAFCTPGCFKAISDILRITSSVRSSVAPFGNCANDTRYPLSCVGTNPAGTREKPRIVTPTNPA